MKGIDICYLGDLSNRCTHGENGAQIITDAPKDNQGRGEMFSPTDLLAVALGSCVITLMGIAAKALNVDISGTTAHVDKQMVTKPHRRLGAVSVTVKCPHHFPDEVKLKLEKAGSQCPVHYSLHPEVDQQFHFHWGVA